jgi:hypothetical protein
MMEEYQALAGMRIGRERKVLGGNVPQRDSVYHKSHMTCS